MRGDPQFAAVLQRHGRAARFCDAHRLAQHGPRRTRSQRQHQLGLHQRAFCFQPPATRVDLLGCRGLVQSPLAALDKFEMLHRIGDIGCATVNICQLQIGVKHLPCWPHERPPCPVLLITRLLAHDHQCGVARPLAHHGAGTQFSNRAQGAICDAMLYRIERFGLFRKSAFPFIDHARLTILRSGDQFRD